MGEAHSLNQQHSEWTHTQEYNSTIDEKESTAEDVPWVLVLKECG